MGEIATWANSTSLKSAVSVLANHRISKFLMIKLASESPFKIRYSLKPKLKKGVSDTPATGDVLLDVNIFAIDLDTKRLDVRYGNSRRYNMGGILDVPSYPDTNSPLTWRGIS